MNSESVNDSGMKKVKIERIKKFSLMLLAISSFVLNIFVPFLALISDIFLSIVSIYDINVIRVIFGDPEDIMNDKKKIRLIRKTNFLIAISCASVLYGADLMITGVIDIFNYSKGIIGGEMNLSINDPGLKALFDLCLGIVLITIGCVILWKSTFKTLFFLDNEGQQVLGFTAGGFLMYSIFLGMGGEKIVSYILITINAYFLIKNLRKSKGVRGLFRAIKDASEKKENIEESLWANWVNFYKTPKTRFFGTIFVTTGFLFGMNFRFVQIDAYQIVFMILIVFP
ncbi:MAG: hypothetical protein ACTSRA_22315, partial [Promethearchaeota archaeon]